MFSVTFMSMLAAGSYAVAAVLASAAAARAWQLRLPSHHLVSWISAAGTFAVLFVFRLLAVEERARAAARAWFVARGAYEERWTWQPAVTSLIIVTAALALVWLFLRNWPGARAPLPEKAHRFARLAILGFVPLYALRLVSFHAFDRILYAGPLRLNWVIDGGLTLAVAAAAVAYLHAFSRFGKFRVAPGRRDRR